jgi:deoxycytidylate deaminase
MNKSIKDIYYMNLAKKQASHSNDPITKVGCVIVKNNKIIAISNNQILKIKNIKIPTISIASQP